MTKRRRSDAREQYWTLGLIFCTIALCGYTGYLLAKFDNILNLAVRVVSQIGPTDHKEF